MGTATVAVTVCVSISVTVWNTVTAVGQTDGATVENDVKVEVPLLRLVEEVNEDGRLLDGGTTVALLVMEVTELTKDEKVLGAMEVLLGTEVVGEDVSDVAKEVET